MARIRVLHPDPDLEAEGLGAGVEAEMPEARALALADRRLVAILPPETQAHAAAPETKALRERKPRAAAAPAGGSLV